MRTWVVAIACISTLASCRWHGLSDGSYAFTESEVLRDDCGLAPNLRFGPGWLRTAGDTVNLMLEEPAIALVGLYRTNSDGGFFPESDTMILDGVLTNTRYTIRGEECLLEAIAIHVEGTTRGETMWDGLAAFTFDSRTPDRCSCKLWIGFRATRQPESS